MKKILGFQPESSAGDVDRDKRADAMLRFLHLVKKIEAFRGKDFEEIFSREDNKREFIENLKPEQFQQLLDGVNGILRKKDRRDWQMDGQTVELRSAIDWGEGYRPPRHEDKPDLLRQTLAAAQEMNRHGDELGDIGLMAAAALNAIHPYNDANGRTGRMMHLLLARDFEGAAKKELKEVLSETGRDKIDINPGWLRTDIDRLIKIDLGIEGGTKNKDRVLGLTGLVISENEEPVQEESKKFKAEVKDEDKSKFLELFERDEEHFYYAIFDYLSGRPDRQKYLLKSEKFSRIMIGPLIESLGQGEVEEILNRYYALKKKYVEILIDSLAHPDKPQYRTQRQGQERSFRDNLKIHIQENIEREQEKARMFEEKKQAEIDKQRQMENEDNEAKAKFEAGECEYETFPPAEINRFRQIEADLKKIISAGQQAEAESQKLPLSEKVKLLKQVLLRLARHLNSQVKVTPRRIERYLQRNQEELLASLPGYQDALKLLEYLDSQEIFTNKFRTSKDNEITFLRETEYVGMTEKWQDFYFQDLFSQSVYYTTGRGSSLRVIMYFAKDKDRRQMSQPVMERSFFTDQPVDYTRRKAVKVEGASPAVHKSIFEISSLDFRRAIIGPDDADKELKSGVGTLPTEGGTYVDIPPRALLHTGYHVVNVIK